MFSCVCQRWQHFYADQCDQIGRFLKVLCNKISSKTSNFFGYFEKPHYFLGNFWKHLGYFLLQYLVILMLTKIDRSNWRFLFRTQESSLKPQPRAQRQLDGRAQAAQRQRHLSHGRGQEQRGGGEKRGGQGSCRLRRPRPRILRHVEQVSRVRIIFLNVADSLSK